MSRSFVVWKFDNIPNMVSLDSCENFDDTPALRFGRSVTAVWPSDVTVRFNPERKRATALTDTLFNTDGIIIASEKLIHLLQKLTIPELEYLPLTVLDHKKKKVPGYQLVHPIQPVSCMDMKEDDLSDPESAAQVFFHNGPITKLKGGDKAGQRLHFGVSFMLSDDEGGFDADDEDTFAELLDKVGLLEAEVGTMLGAPHFHREEMDEIFDTKNDITVLHMHGSVVGDIFREGTFQIFANKKAVKKGEIDVYWEGGS